MTIHETLDFNDTLTDEEIDEIREGAKRPIIYDDDCPPLSQEALRQMVIDRERRLQTGRAL